MREFIHRQANMVQAEGLSLSLILLGEASALAVDSSPLSSDAMSSQHRMGMERNLPYCIRWSLIRQECSSTCLAGFVFNPVGYPHQKTLAGELV